MCSARQFITREYAICIYLGYKRLPENIEKARKEFESIHNTEIVDICYINDPLVPVTATQIRINHNPSIFHLYLDMNTPSSALTPLPSCKVDNKKIAALINDVILPFDEDFDVNLYDQQWVSLEQVKSMFEIQMHHMTIQGFVAFATSNKLILLKSELSLQDKIAFYNVLVLRPKYRETALAAIMNKNSAISMYLKQLKSTHTIIGYCRKSPGKESLQTRKIILERMVLKSKKRGLSDRVYVSPSSLAKSTIAERDKNNSISICGAVGDTQDFLKYLKNCRKNIIISIQDFAGLSTNIFDLKQFLINHPKIAYIHIDLAPLKDDFEYVPAQKIIDDDVTLAQFDCRKRSPPRSL